MFLPRSLVLLLVLPAAVAADKLDPAVERFRDLAGKPGLDREPLRLEIAEFVRFHVGKPASPQAAAVLNQLPAPLDRLDPKTIPALDVFDWQPKELVAVLGEHRGRQGAPVTCVAWTRDGKRVISGGTQGYIRLWDPVTLRQHARLSTQGYPTCLALSRDSKVLAAGTAGGVVHVWDLSETQPKLTGTFGIGTSTVYSVDISPDGKLLAAGVFDGLVHTFDLEGSKPKVKTQLAGHKSAVRAVQFSSDSHTLATAAQDGTFRWWSFPSGEKINELGTLPVHTGPISCMIHRGREIIAGCDDGTIARVSLGTKFTKGTSFKTPSAITAINYSPTGALTTSHGDNIVRVWATTATMPKVTATVEGHFSWVAGFAYSPDGRTMATGSSDWTVRLWGMGGIKGVERYPLRGHWIGASPIVFSPDDHLLGSVSGDRTARTWDVTKAAPAQTAQFPPTLSLYKGEAFGLSSLAFTPDSKALAVSGSSATVQLWDVVKRSSLRTFAAPTNPVGSLVFTPDGQSLFATGGLMIFGWTTASAKEVAKVTTADRHLNALALSPDARFGLAGTGYYVYDKGKPLMKDGKYVYTDIALRMFDNRRGQGLQERKDLAAPMGPVSFLPDGRAVCAVWNESPTIWDVSRESLKEGKVLKGFGSLAHPYVFSPDQRFAVVPVNNALRLVDLEKETTLRQWTFDETVYNYVFSPDGRYLAISLVTGPIYILRLEPSPAPASGK
jgi:WD40 repeat protein